MKRFSPKRYLPPLLLVLAGVLAYWNSFDGVFVFDDTASIRDNPHIRVLWPLSEAMSLPLWNSATTVDGRPLLSLSLALNHRFFGPDPWGYHLINLLIHIGAGLLLFGIVRRTLDLPRFRERYAGRGTRLALAVALIWLLHPLQTESVTYIVQRAESLMGMLYLLTMYCAIRGFTNQGSGGRGQGSGGASGCRWFVASVCACAIGMGVKQTMFSAPLLVLLYDGLFVSDSLRAALARRWRLYASLGATWLIVFGIIGATWTESTIDFVKINPVSYLLTQPLVLLYYLRLAFWPSPLVLSYSWTLESEWPRIVFPGLAVLGMLVVMFRGIWRRQWVGFVLAWFFLILAPTSSVAPMRQAIFEHRMYLSLAAVVVLAVVGAEGAIRKLAASENQRLVFGGGLVMALVIAFGCLTHARNEDYHSALRIWQDNLVHQPDSSLAHNNLGNALHAVGRTPEAIAHYREAIQGDPDDAEAHYNLGLALQATGRPQDAVAHYRQVLRLKPNSADAHNNLGNILHASGLTSEAIAHYHEALRVNPAYAQAHYNMGYALQSAGRMPDAIAAYQRALRLNPDMAEVHYNLGNVLQVLGRLREAIPHYREALRLKTDYAEAYNNLGNAMLSSGRPQDAIAHYREALRLNPGYAEVHYNLGRAGQALGQPEVAIAHYQHALRLQPDFADAHYNRGNALVALGRIEEAIGHYQQAVNIHPDHIGAHNNLGALYRETGQHADAIRHFEQAVRLNPDSAVARENLTATQAMLALERQNADGQNVPALE